MKNNNVYFNELQLWESKAVILIGQQDQFKYDGKVRTDERLGVSISVAAQGQCFAAYNVKIPNGQLLPVTDEEIADACATMRPIFVKFNGFKAKPYPKDNRIAFSCSAESVEIVTESDLDLFGGDKV